eukprot:8974672-Alexandrium_andersonii.AAC.1
MEPNGTQVLRKRALRRVLLRDADAAIGSSDRRNFLTPGLCIGQPSARRTETDKDRQGQTGTDRDRQGQTGTD